MGDPRQPHIININGTNNFPSIPHPPRTHPISDSRHSLRHGNNLPRPDDVDGHSNNSYSLLCIGTTLCQIVGTIVVMAIMISFFVLTVFSPNLPEFSAKNATLTQFNLNDNTLHYDLAVNFTIRNPNYRIQVYYDHVEARASYKGQRFSVVQLDPFFQGIKSTNNVVPEFRGQNVVLLGDREVSEYDDEKSNGMYDIDVELYLVVRLNFEIMKIMIKPKIGCHDLKIPLSSTATVVSRTYEPKSCACSLS